LLPHKKTKAKIHPPTWNLEEAMVTGKLFLDEIAEGIPLMNAPVSGKKNGGLEENRS
jgi:hypothetical protein